MRARKSSGAVAIDVVVVVVIVNTFFVVYATAMCGLSTFDLRMQFKKLFHLEELRIAAHSDHFYANFMLWEIQRFFFFVILCHKTTSLSLAFPCYLDALLFFFHSLEQLGCASLHLSFM